MATTAFVLPCLLRSAIMRTGAPLLISTVLLMLAVTQSHAMRVQKVVSASGVEAWLVEDHATPLISMQFAFKGAGSAQDATGKEGAANLLSGTLDEGVGEYDSRMFQQRLEELAAKLSFSAGLDHFTGSLQTLTANRDAAFDLLRLALTAPRFETGDVERIRRQILSRLKAEEQDPESMASREWFRLVFGQHPYARPVKGDAATVAAITPDDLRAFLKRNFARSNLHIVVVGDITPDELRAALDRIFGDLPAQDGLKPVAAAAWPGQPQLKVLPMPNPQSVAQFGMQGLKRDHPDFIPAFILNYILGGGGFASTLMQEVREKRGLAYSVYSYLYTLEEAGLLIGGVATENKSVKQSLEVIEAELRRLAADGPTEAELEGAKNYLIGSYALRFDSGAKIAQQLLGIRLEGFGPDYIEKRNGLIAAVTLADLKRVARSLFNPDGMIVTVVGQPEGLAPTSGVQPRG